MTSPKPFNLTPLRRAALESVRDGNVYLSGRMHDLGDYRTRAGGYLNREIKALHEAGLVKVGPPEGLKNWVEITDAGRAALDA